jgi:hypothetical protein
MIHDEIDTTNHMGLAEAKKINARVGWPKLYNGEDICCFGLGSSSNL